jgi:hypothetical protein
MIKPDPREVLWYDVNNILNAEPDMLPHYWTILIDKMRMLDDGRPRAICKTCDECLDLFQFKDTVYCPKAYRYTRDRHTGIVVSIEHKTTVPHPVIFETLRESINRMLERLYDRLQEPSGYRYDLLDLETYLYRAPDDGIMETMHGDVTKAMVKKWMYSLKNLLLSRLMELRTEIRFSSAMRTPSINVR